MSELQNVADFFMEHTELFTIYVVEQMFAMNRGNSYFKQYLNTENFIIDDEKIQRLTVRILAWIQQKIPPVATLVEQYILSKTKISTINIVEVITALNKLFTVTEHQAAGINILDPIIIEEANINSRNLAQLIALHKESITQPTIILILKDNNFERAKLMLSQCPNGIHVKFIRNSGHAELHRIINSGATNTKEFVESFAQQCFSTCSQTDRNILLNDEWRYNDLIHSVSPLLFKTHSDLLFDEKSSALKSVNMVIDELSRYRYDRHTDTALLKSFELIAKLKRVYCLDSGRGDIIHAYRLAEELNIDILKAQVYRYAQFIPNISRKEQQELLGKAVQIFRQNNVEDHALYCQNNLLMHSFYTERIHTKPFRELQEEAICNVPGMVGMSIILNNVGVASLYTRDFSGALSFFNKGLDYSKERLVQKVGIQSNILVTRACAYESIGEIEILKMLDLVFANFNESYLPFIASNYVLNMLFILLEQHKEIVTDVLQRYKIQGIVAAALKSNAMGSGSLVQQLMVLNVRYPNLPLSEIGFPTQVSPISGVRKEFITQKGYNPIIFNAWL